MKFINIIILFLLLNTFCNGQDLYLETFDTKASVKSWRIEVSKPEIIHFTNNYSFNSQTYIKPSKDSFLVFFDTSGNPDYQIKLTKTFKAIKAESISFKFSAFSFDTLNDYLLISCRIIDKSKKTLEYAVFPSYCRKNFISIGGSSVQLMTNKDSLWAKADSIIIIFQFKPSNQSLKIDRKIVIDEIILRNITIGVINTQKAKFEVFPNPSNGQIYFKFSATLKPYLIMLYDATGKEITRNSAIIKNNEHLIIENLSKGIYFIKVLFNDGQLISKKIEIN